MDDKLENGVRMTAEEMDEQRKINEAYEYLCRLEESKKWIEACIKEELPPTLDLEESLRNGVYLAKLAHFISPDKIRLKNIYDADQSRYKSRGLHFRHTDNINHWLKSLKEIHLPQTFYPETTDIYDRKNIPRLIYCLHALSLYLFKIGKAPQIQTLFGKISFTDEEISNMKKALDQYGIQMPAFSKIGGILANEVPVDEATLHAAIIAINKAIEEMDAEATLKTLFNEAAHLANVDSSLSLEYQEILWQAKSKKTEFARNKSFNMDIVADVYDELLTQAEVQGHINMTNNLKQIVFINELVEKGDIELLFDALTHSNLSFRNVLSERSSKYLSALIQAKKDKFEKTNDSVLSKENIQETIDTVNNKEQELHLVFEIIEKLNESLDSDDHLKTFSLLQEPLLDFQKKVDPSTAPLYHEELKCMKLQKTADLTLDDVRKGLIVLDAVASINFAIEANNVHLLGQSLCSPDVHVSHVDLSFIDKYLQEMKESKSSREQLKCPFLTHGLIQELIFEVNQKVASEQERIEALSRINESLDDPSQSHLSLFELLSVKEAHFYNLRKNVSLHYQQLLKSAKQQKSQNSGDADTALWFEEVQEIIDIANKDDDEGRQISSVVAAINISVMNDNIQDLQNHLSNPVLLNNNYNKHLLTSYMSCLKDFKLDKSESGNVGSNWMMNKLQNDYKYFFNVATLESAWCKEEGIWKDYSLITRDDIKNCISEVNKSNERHWLFKKNEIFIVKLQAILRGFLERQKVQKKLNELHLKSPAVKSIQLWWRKILKKKEDRKIFDYYLNNKEFIIKAQSLVRMKIIRKRFCEKIDFYKKNESYAVLIQAFVRSAFAKHDYKALMNGENPPLSVVRKFVHLLDITDRDYLEEIELDKQHQQVIHAIKTNQQLEQNLSDMDIKIGLLVKNRITLQDVVSQNKSLQIKPLSNTKLIGGLKALSKNSHNKLQAYQHLFYLLQTQPTYLARLIFQLPQSKTTRFMESAVFCLFNYASNLRDEYMLLKLFKTALQEEIQSKIVSPSEISTGNPMVVKMIVSFNRNSRGQAPLKELLNPLVMKILNDEKLKINTNVVDVYKQWINQLEASSGQPGGLPYEVSVESALKQEEVAMRVSDAVVDLQKNTDFFLYKILSSAHMIPYPMRYMSKVMKTTLQLRFPQTPEKEILKIIGNFIYYRYINSAIVAPDAFDIIEVSALKGLTNEQRRNLASVAKILQFAASNKGFGPDSPHLVSMNKYIMDSHSKFKKYFLEVCDVPEPEVFYGMDRYSDVARIMKPIVYISVGEIVEMHKLLLEHQNTVAPNPKDPIHELLDDLGEVVEVDELLGEKFLDDRSKVQMSKTEISLTLSNKFQLNEAAGVSNDHNLNSLFLKTKQALVDILRCQKTGETLDRVLDIKSTQAEESIYKALVKERSRKLRKTTSSQLIRQPSEDLDSTHTSLHQLKQTVLKNLSKLKSEGFVSCSNGYQDVVNSIVKDVRNQRVHRQRRKLDMSRIKVTLKSLLQKRAFYEEQVNYYNQYVKTCLDRQAAKAKKRNSVKYTGARLHEKGVLLSIEELQSNQYKNILFEISSTDVAGLFIVNAKFMGVNMEKVELQFQDLLELQFQGTAIMKMFDKARVNVNLLIHLLNHKFYGTALSLSSQVITNNIINRNIPIAMRIEPMSS